MLHTLRLRAHGYEVSSAFGSGAAKAALQTASDYYDLFIIGSAAPESTRLEMAYWLRARFPQTRILALHAAEHQRLDDLKYNAREELPDTWVRIIAAAAVDRIATA